MRVLLADDDLIINRLLEHNLKQWGYETITTDNGIDALRILQGEDAPRLAVLDWMMPGMTGDEVCREARQIFCKVPVYVILLTAKAGKKNIVAGLESGADDYVVKPFDNNELRSRIAVGRRIVELQTALSNRLVDLQQALSHITTLQGLLPICMHCKRIRNDSGYWEKIELYISRHSKAEFSHGICKECADKHYPDLCNGGNTELDKKAV